MSRKCSHCGKIGHNSRTCTTYKRTITTTSTNSIVSNGIRVFGVQLHDLSSSPYSSCCSNGNIKNNDVAIKKCLSLDCLLSSSSPLLNYSSPSPLSPSRISTSENNSNKTSVEYLSDGVFCRAQERKKGVAWTEEEHRNFLCGLEKLGKGDWRGVSKKFVPTRTPTQVASHAQKYFLRQSIILHNRKRRSSLFDMIGGSNKPTQSQANNSNSQPSDQSDSSQFQVLHNNAIPIWPCGSSPSPQTNFSSSKRVTLKRPISPNEAPNLELTLAPPSPRLFYQDNSPPRSLLFGPISVI